MSIVIFIVVIVALIVVHEFGHFVVAKLSGMRVDEFGLGYPPRALLLGKVGETEYTLNWIPFGGFVKIFGEDLSAGEVEDPRAFSSKNRFAQAIVLVAGIAMNLLFAYVLITGALIMGTPRALSQDEIATAQHVELAVASVLEASPAASAGLLPGDSILSAEDGHYAFSGTDPAAFTKFVSRLSRFQFGMQMEK
jgi:regulator of sigma E protease